LWEQNQKRKAQGLEPLPYPQHEEYFGTTIEPTLNPIKMIGQLASSVPFQEGVGAGGVSGGSVGSVNAIRHERALTKTKARRAQRTAEMKDTYLQYEKVRREIEEVGPKITQAVDQERREALNKVPEAELWVKARELQESLATPTESLTKTIQDYDGVTPKDQVIEYIMDNLTIDNEWISRYEELLYEAIETNEELGAADKLFIKFQLANPNNPIQDVWSLRRILEETVATRVNEDGTMMFPGGLNQVAEIFTTELETEMSSIQFFQEQMKQYEPGSLEYLFLEGFINRQVYKNMPVAHSVGWFDSETQEAGSTDQAHLQATINQTRKFREGIKERIGKSDNFITTEHVRTLLDLLKTSQNVDTRKVESLAYNDRVATQLEDLGGEIHPAEAFHTAEVQTFLDDYTEIISNVIYYTVDRTSSPELTGAALDIIKDTMGVDFVVMLADTLRHTPIVKAAESPKGLNLQIIEGLALQLEEEKDPVKQQEIKDSIAHYKERAKQQEGSGYTFAQEDEQLIGGNLKRVIDMLGETNYGGDIAKISAKELFQNSVDTVEKKIRSGENPDAQMYVGKWEQAGTEIEGLVMVDEGMGMLPEQVLRLFLPAFVSGKGVDDGGGFGMAKIAFLKGSKRFVMHTISKDKDGRFKGTRLSGTGDGWSQFTLNPPKVPMPLPEGELIKLSPDLRISWNYLSEVETPPTTGTAFSTVVPKAYNGMSWLRKGADHIHDFPVRKLQGVESEPNFEGVIALVKHPMEGIGIGGEVSKRIVLNPRREKDRPRLVKKFETPYATIEVLDKQFEDKLGEAERRTSRWFDIPVLNRGILQFDFPARFQDQVTLPTGMLINIKPKVPADHENYPFEFNREGVRHATKQVLEGYIGDLGRGARQQQLDVYNKVKENAPRFDDGNYFLDGSQAIPEDLITFYMQDPVIIQLVKDFADIQNKVLREIKQLVPQSQLYGRATYNGFMVNTQALGVHFGKPGQETASAIYLDPQQIMYHADDFIEMQDLYARTAQETGTEVQSDGTVYSAPEAIWGDITIGKSGVKEVEPLGFNQRLVQHFYELTLGVSLHEAMHQRIDEEGEGLAREFTFLVGSLVDKIGVDINKLVPKTEEEAQAFVTKILEYHDEFSKYKNKQFSTDFITSQGGHDTYAFRSDGGPSTQAGLRQLGQPGIEEGGRSTAGDTQLELFQQGEITTLRDTLNLDTLELVPNDTRLVPTLEAITTATGMKAPALYEGEQYKNAPVMVKSHYNFNGDQIKGFEGTLTGVFMENFTSIEDDIYAYVKPPTGDAQLTLVDEIITEVGGVPFNQLGRQITRGSQAIKGSTTFLADGRAHMKFFRTADLTTVAHEFMHILSRHMSVEEQSAAQVSFIRNRFGDMDDKSQQDFLAKLETVWDIFQQDPTDPILQKPEANMLLTGYMEHIARQFEMYLFEGKAPTRALTSAFKSVRDSMRETYDKIADIPDIRADMDPVMKNVFDRMVAGSRALTTPVARQVLIEGGVYTVYVSRSSDKIVKALLKKLREGYSEVQGMHDDILRYAEMVMGKKFLRDKEFQLRLSKTGTYAEGKATIDYIDRQLLKEQKKYHREVVDEIKALVAGVDFDNIDKKFADRIKKEIAGIDFQKMTVKKLNTLHQMREWLTTNLRKGIIDQNMMNISLKELKQLDRLSQKNIYDFTIQELQMLRDALGSIITDEERTQFLRLKKKLLILNRESERLIEFGATLTPKDKYSGLNPDPNAKTEEEKLKGFFNGIIQAAKLGGTQPHRLLLYIAGFDKNNPLYNFVNVIREGTRVVAARNVADMEWMRDLIASLPRSTAVENWSKKLLPENEEINPRYLAHYKVMNNLGKEVELHLTVAERLTIYMYSLNEDATRHMLDGGIVMPQVKGMGINYKLTRETLAEILSEMTPDEKYVAHQMMEYYSTAVAPAINKVSTNLLGYGLAKELNYFPIFAEGKARGNTEVLNKPQLSKTMQQFQKKLIDRMDFLKSRTKSTSPLYIHDAFWAMQLNLQDVNRYIGLAEPLNFVKALWRDTDNRETGIYYQVARSWGPSAVKTIDKWIDRIEDPSVQEGPESNWIRVRRRTAIAAQLGANVFVSSYQRVSLMLATNYDISRSSVFKAILENSGPTTGFGIGAAHSMAELARELPQLAQRFETGPNVDVHELYMDSLTRHAWTKPTTGLEDVKRIHNWATFKTAVNTLSVTSSMKFIKDNDAWALSTIWDAVNIEGKKQGWNEEQIKEKFLEIYYNTQPNYDTENLSLMMSDKRALAKVAFATYQTMPNQIYNELEYHIREWGVKNDKETDRRQRAINTLQMADKVITTAIGQQMVINAIRQLRYLGDDDEEPYLKGVLLGTLRSLVAVIPYIGGLTADGITALVDPSNRYDAFDTPGSFILQLYKGAAYDIMDVIDSMKTGDLERAAYKAVRLTTKILGMAYGYSWDTILNQAETVTEKLVD
jgi:hypothetical protein